MLKFKSSATNNLNKFQNNVATTRQTKHFHHHHQPNQQQQQQPNKQTNATARTNTLNSSTQPTNKKLTNNINNNANNNINYDKQNKSKCKQHCATANVPVKQNGTRRAQPTKQQTNNANSIMTTAPTKQTPISTANSNKRTHSSFNTANQLVISAVKSGQQASKQEPVKQVLQAGAIGHPPPSAGNMTLPQVSAVSKQQLAARVKSIRGE